MTNLICGGCRKDFEATISKNSKANNEINTGRNILICTKCGRTLPSSKKEPTGEVVGRQHTHREWKDGDIVT